MFAEYVGVTQEVASLIERCRREASETKNDILLRILPRPDSVVKEEKQVHLDLGQGIQLPDGEKLYLFLSKPSGSQAKPDGIAEVCSGELFLDNERVVPSHGSVITPAMKMIQERAGHKNKHGKIISLSAFRQWHVIRGDRLVPLDDLKDPSLRRTRSRTIHGIDVKSLDFRL